MKFALSGSGSNRIVYVWVAFITNPKHGVKKKKLLFEGSAEELHTEKN